jgi:hypothetical protein
MIGVSLATTPPPAAVLAKFFPAPAAERIAA